MLLLSDISVTKNELVSLDIKTIETEKVIKCVQRDCRGHK